MEDKIDFKFEVTAKGTAWSITIDWEVLQQYIDECPRDERLTLSGTFDDDKLGKVFFALLREIDEMRHIGGRLKKREKCKRKPWPNWHWKWPWNSE